MSKIVEYRGSEYRVKDDGTIENTKYGNALKEDGRYYDKIMAKIEEGNYRDPDENPQTIMSDPGVHLMDKQERIEFRDYLRDLMTANQVKFCHEYVGGEYMGNMTRSYLNVYKPEVGGDIHHRESEYLNAQQASSKLLDTPKVRKYINLLLYESGLNTETVDTQLLFLIQQHQDKKSKIQAIKEFNKMRGRIEDRISMRAEVSHENNADYSNLSDEELEQLIRLLDKTKANRDNEVDVQ